MNYINIYLCFGRSRVCFGVIFFRDEKVVKVIYDKLLAENILKLLPNSISFDFISSVRTKTANENNLGLSYFDGYLKKYSNALIQYDESKIFSSDVEEEDYRAFANVMFGKINPDEALIEI